MATWGAYLAAAVLMVGAGQASALALGDCTRTTHISHGGEADHRDLGEGRVMWRDWWSQEGTSDTLVLVDCDSGETLRLLTAEDNMTARLPFDRTEKALEILETEHRAARVFATLPRIADALDGTAEVIELGQLTHEVCACAALYADLRADKISFELKGAGE